jgi:hypothetical protein
MYGGFVLRIYDHDRRGALPAVYGGAIRKVIFKASNKAPAASGAGGPSSTTTVLDKGENLIAKLQRDLWALGFWVFPRTNKDGVEEPVVSDTFDWRTEWAVREFQIAARMKHVAVDNPERKANTPEEKKELSLKGKRLFRLSRKANEHDFSEEPTGVLTVFTAKAIKFWLENGYRCPLVIQAMTIKNPTGDRAPVAAYAENIWCYNEIPRAAYKMHAWDFSGYFEEEVRECVVVGDYQTYMRWAGPCSVPSKGQCLPEAEVSPKNFLNKDWDASDLSVAERSTFRVVAGVSEQECRGYLDSVNFYDNCLGSIGPCHWTGPMDKGEGVVGPGELCGLMAYWEIEHPALFERCFSRLGIWGPQWGSPPGKQKEQEGRPWCGAGHNPTGFVYVKGSDYLNKPAGSKNFTQVPDASAAQRDFEESSWLKSWTWTYRLEMSARTIPEFRQAMWEYAVRRIRRIRLMSHVGSWVPEIRESDGSTRKAIMSDILTSEQGTAVLLRFHVRFPAMLTSPTGKYAVLHDALKAVMNTKLFKTKEPDGRPGATLPPNKWNTSHEIALVDAMLAMAKRVGEVATSSRQARFWPFANQLPAGSKGARTPYETHTWFPLVEVTVLKKPKGHGKKPPVEVKELVPKSELQLSAERGSFQLPP